ncbi:MAG: M20/M25/M40 family metallo-hydrolase [Bacteroidota bacterium]
MKNNLITLTLLLGLISSRTHGQNPLIDSIRAESSQEEIMETVSYLADVYGPRMLGTPKYYNSVVFAEKKLKEYGISTRLESFDRGYRGWDFSGFEVEMVAPSYGPINAYPLAYTKSTEGEQLGDLVFIRRLREAYDQEGSLEGKIIMFQGLYRPVSSVERPMSERIPAELLNRAAANPDPNDVLIGYHSRISVPRLFAMRKKTKQRMAEFFQFLEKEGAIAAIEPSDFPYGLLHADGNRAVPSFRLLSDHKPLASFVISNEHFGRLLRLQNLGLQPKLKVQLTSNFYTESSYHKNLVAEIPGTDPKLEEELVILGAHLDSWHSGTGAVDNAANCALLIEAMRIVKKIGAQPKRTIRLVLWGGEEHVFAGSEFYVDTHVGDMVEGEPKGANPKISAYLNLDNGAGKIRGIYLMGNKATRPFFAEYLQPFPSSNTLTLQNANQTDHWLFDYHNVPAFQFIQDPLDYISAIHHTNADMYEYVPPEDQVFNAELVAYLALKIANERNLLPRKRYNFTKPSRKGNTTFQLAGFEQAQEVSVVGNFNNWDMFSLPMYKTSEGWEMKIDLPKGKYYYKFIVDGHWTSNPAEPEEKLAKDGKGHGGLSILYVE